MTKELPQEIESMVQEIEILFHHNTGDYIDGVREIVERYLSLPKQEEPKIEKIDKDKWTYPTDPLVYFKVNEIIDKVNSLISKQTNE